MNIRLATYGTTSRGREEKAKMFCVRVRDTLVCVCHQLSVYMTLSVMFCNASLMRASLRSRSNASEKVSRGEKSYEAVLKAESAIMVWLAPFWSLAIGQLPLVVH